MLLNGAASFGVLSTVLVAVSQKDTSELEKVQKRATEMLKWLQCPPSKEGKTACNFSVC